MRTTLFIQPPLSAAIYARDGGIFGNSPPRTARGSFAHATMNLPGQETTPEASPAAPPATRSNPYSVITPDQPVPAANKTPSDFFSREAEAQALDYSVPFGESGLGEIDNVNHHNALLRLFAFESQHAAAQRSEMTARGEVPAQVDIRIKTAVDEDGFPVPVGGVTESRSDEDGDGTHEIMMRELAMLSQTRRLMISGGTTLFGMESRPMPS
ncbi:MAG: hypothetical protein JXA52_06045, partial [Planctomycetes bacterium]|nr:hypothetical protein [Planctomycetota bacterium]